MSVPLFLGQQERLIARVSDPSRYSLLISRSTSAGDDGCPNRHRTAYHVTLSTTMLPSIITGLLLLTRKNYKPIEQSPDNDANSNDSENKEFLVVQPDTGNYCPY
jgi:hypothetical protein